MTQRVSGFSRWLLLLTVFLSPFFFVQMSGKYIAPWDFFYIIVISLFILKTYRFEIGPTKHYIVGVVLLMLSIAISTFNSPFPLNSFLDAGQYYLIFLAVVPSVLSVFRDRRSHWQAFLAITASLNLVAIVGVLYGIVTGSFAMELVYGNHNIIPVLTAGAAILSAGLASTKNYSNRARIIAGGLAIVYMFGVLLSPSNGALIMIAVAGWFFIWRATVRSKVPTRAFWVASLASGVLSAVVLFSHLDAIFRLGFEHRWPMYREAFLDGFKVFPIGGGMSSGDIYLSDLPRGISREVHNIWLSHWLEFGVLGVVGTVLILIEWPVAVYHAISEQQGMEGWKFGIIVLFAAWFIQVQFQPAPVTRVWWVIFALSWTVMLD